MLHLLLCEYACCVSFTVWLESSTTLACNKPSRLMNFIAAWWWCGGAVESRAASEALPLHLPAKTSGCLFFSLSRGYLTLALPYTWWACTNTGEGGGGGSVLLVFDTQQGNVVF